MDYPEHEHPHGVANSKPNKYRIWICDDCFHAFTDDEIRTDAERGEWGHFCKSHPFKSEQRCESHLEPYIPDLSAGKLTNQQGGIDVIK